MPNGRQDESKMIQKWPQNKSKTNPKWPQNDLKTKLKSSHSYNKVSSKSHGGPTVKLEEIPQCKWINSCVNNIKDDRRWEIVDRFMLSCVEEESDSDDYCVPTENDNED